MCIRDRLRAERRSLGRAHGACVTVGHALLAAVTLVALRLVVSCAPRLSATAAPAPAPTTSQLDALATGTALARGARALALGLGALSDGVQAARVHLQSNRACAARAQLALARRAWPELLGFGCVLRALLALPFVGALASLGIGAFASGVLLRELGDEWLYAGDDAGADAHAHAHAASTRR